MSSALTVENEVMVPPDQESTGLPLLKSWNSTYAFAMATFVLWIILLYALTECFS